MYVVLNYESFIRQKKYVVYSTSEMSSDLCVNGVMQSQISNKCKLKQCKYIYKSDIYLSSEL